MYGTGTSRSRPLVDKRTQSVRNWRVPASRITPLTAPKRPSRHATGVPRTAWSRLRSAAAGEALDPDRLRLPSHQLSFSGPLSRGVSRRLPVFQRQARQRAEQLSSSATTRRHGPSGRALTVRRGCRPDERSMRSSRPGGPPAAGMAAGSRGRTGHRPRGRSAGGAARAYRSRRR